MASCHNGHLSYEPDYLLSHCRSPSAKTCANEEYGIQTSAADDEEPDEGEG